MMRWGCVISEIRMSFPVEIIFKRASRSTGDLVINITVTVYLLCF